MSALLFVGLSFAKFIKSLGIIENKVARKLCFLTSNIGIYTLCVFLILISQANIHKK